MQSLCDRSLYIFLATISTRRWLRLKSGTTRRDGMLLASQVSVVTTAHLTLYIARSSRLDANIGQSLVAPGAAWLAGSAHIVICFVIHPLVLSGKLVVIWHTPGALLGTRRVHGGHRLSSQLPT